MLSPGPNHNNHITCLILGAVSDIIPHMQRPPFEEVAISPKPGAGTAPRSQRKVFASSNFRKSPHRLDRSVMFMLMPEQPVEY
jgi:hypothetical protein